jgi:hypothetical protein
LDALVAAHARTDARLDALVAVQIRTDERLDRLTARIDEFVRSTDQHFRAIETELGNHRGRLLELEYERKGHVYLSSLAHRVQTLNSQRFANQLADAVDAGLLTEAERLAILLADLVLSGQRRSDHEPIYLLVEVSAGIGPSDVERASLRARFLEKLGRPVLPVVAGNRIDPAVKQLAAAAGVWQVIDGHDEAPDVTPPD